MSASYETRPAFRSRSPVEGPDWDAIVAHSRHGSVYQTAAWAEAKGERTERQVVVLRSDNDDSILGGAQLLIRRIAPGVTAAYVPYGPLVLTDAAHKPTASVQRLVDLIESRARDAGCAVVFIQPPRTDRSIETVLTQRGYRPSPLEVGTSAGIEVPLDVSNDEMFNRLVKVRRRNVRRSERRGVTVDLVGPDHLPMLHRLHTQSARHHGFDPMSLDYLNRQWTALGEAGYLHIFAASIEGQVRAAGTCLAYGPLAEFKLTGWDGSDIAGRACINDAINWAMMKWANSRGFERFDLGGLPRELAIEALEQGSDERLRGTSSEFKHGWGAEVAIFPTTFERLLRPVGHLTYRLPSRLLSDGGWGGRMINWVRRT